MRRRAHRATLRRAAGCAMWGCWVCAAVWGGAIALLPSLGNTALQEGRAGMVPGKGAEGGTGDARFELGPDSSDAAPPADDRTHPGEPPYASYDSR